MLERTVHLSYNETGDFMATKTNAVRLVEQAGISCSEAFYEFDENDLNGNHAAEAIGMNPEQVFKTLVTRGDDGALRLSDKSAPVIRLDAKSSAEGVLRLHVKCDGRRGNIRICLVGDDVSPLHRLKPDCLPDARGPSVKAAERALLV